MPMLRGHYLLYLRSNGTTSSDRNGITDALAATVLAKTVRTHGCEHTRNVILFLRPVVLI